MGKKSKKSKAMKTPKLNASPAQALLMGALGGAAVMFFGRDRLRQGYEQLRTRVSPQAHPAE